MIAQDNGVEEIKTCIFDTHLWSKCRRKVCIILAQKNQQLCMFKEEVQHQKCMFKVKSQEPRVWPKGEKLKQTVEKNIKYFNTSKLKVLVGVFYGY